MMLKAGGGLSIPLRLVAAVGCLTVIAATGMSLVAWQAGLQEWMLALAALAAGFVIAAGAVSITIVRVARPMAQMADAARRLAAGEWDAAIPCQGWHGAFGTLSSALAALRDGMVHNHRQHSEAAELLQRQQEQARLGTERETQAAALVVEAIGGALTRMADRDLSRALDTTLPGDYDRLRIDLGAAVDELRTALLSVVENADNISATSASVSDAASQLNDRSRKQAASIEQAVASMNQLARTVRATAESAMDVSIVINKTRLEAEQSGTTMERAVSIMDAILMSSRRIGEVTSIIDEMAFQTNLLALNAGVEAARAGDAGRGFAVVASEVRALAQRSAAAAKEIRDLITKSGQQVESGVHMVGDAGKALSRILAQVMEITRSVAAIAAAGKEQSRSLHEFATAATELEKSAENNAAMVEQTAVATQGLSADSVRLVELTRQFRLTEESTDGQTFRSAEAAPALSRLGMLKVPR